MTVAEGCSTSLMTDCYHERPLSIPATVEALSRRLKSTQNILVLSSPTDLGGARSVYSELFVAFLLRRLTSEDLRGWYL